MDLNPIPRRRLKNDVDQRMLAVAQSTDVYMVEEDLRALDPRNLDAYIGMLREGEAAVRLLRKRLEALRDGSARTCPVCQRPVAGRSDRIFCTNECRVRSHRESRRNA